MARAPEGGEIDGPRGEEGWMIRVLVVEDEPLQRRAMALSLTEAGFDVAVAGDAAACLAMTVARPIDIVVLDLGLPDQDGLALASDLRRRGDVGLVVVTRRSAPEARIEALDIGADDYLVKPVHFGELAARIRSVMRRRRPADRTVTRLGRWTVDLEARTASVGAVSAGLTRGEFDITALLIGAEGRIVSREDLLAAISRRPLEADLRSVDVLVSRIRRKMGTSEDGRDLIVTVPGFGYQLGAPSSFG
jgi:DNA-binding response OmpR family regulator